MSARARLKVAIRGAVQGVGFRPYVYRLAGELRLDGSVRNTAQGVSIEVEGPQSSLEDFLRRLPVEMPSHALIQSLEPRFLDPLGLEGFRIESSEVGQPTALILPDLATCPDCRTEVFDPGNRRYRYPFTNCTYCGPRYSIIRALPYDRPNTTMREFEQCPACAAEYADPGDRRFHAQPNACPVCGPRLELWDESGAALAEGDVALRLVVAWLASGKIIALKGIGGFQLLVDAASDSAVRRLRERKHREEKPLAVLFPSLVEVEKNCRLEDNEARLLTSPQAPIVLLPRLPGGGGQVRELVAPGNPYLGAMMPCSPLHHLLARDFGGPLVATSGNLSDEPICIDNTEAVRRLAGIADGFLVHNRPIARHIDDSVVRLLLGRELVLRRARGYAPLPLTLGLRAGPALAVGAHLKNAVAVSVERDVFLSQHIGDLDTEAAREAMVRVSEDLTRLYQVKAERVACDLHPDYASTQLAARLHPQPFPVQHHLAHVLACLAENELEPPCLGISWDGTGWGLDRTVWGGEFLRVFPGGFERVAHLRSFPLPGGERAVREPRRCALGVVFEAGKGSLDWAPPGLRAAFTKAEWSTLRRMLETGTRCPGTTSVGRLFDAVAALSGIRQFTHFEGQAAMEVEFALGPDGGGQPYPFQLTESGRRWIVDWEPCIRNLASDVVADRSVSEIVAKFHSGLVEAAVAVACRVGESRVVLSGGCFQNRHLAEQMVKRLREEGFRVYWHQRIPPNDGGIAVGQLAALAFGIRSIEDVSGSTGSDR